MGSRALRLQNMITAGLGFWKARSQTDTKSSRTITNWQSYAQKLQCQFYHGDISTKINNKYFSYPIEFKNAPTKKTVFLFQTSKRYYPIQLCLQSTIMHCNNMDAHHTIREHQNVSACVWVSLSHSLWLSENYVLL